jgi:iron complex outermembrane receptor protein
VGNPRISSEVVRAFETGYRVQPASFLSADVAVFHNAYKRLFSPSTMPRFVPGVPWGIAEVQMQNTTQGESWGAEASITASPVPAWRLIGSYSYLAGRFSGPPLTDPSVAFPRHQLSLQSSLDITRRISLDTALRRIDGFEFVPGYLTVDLRLTYRPNDGLEFSIAGRNLLDNRHPEQSSVPFAVTAEVPRSLFGRVTLHF